jgi:hypothetical protein
MCTFLNVPYSTRCAICDVVCDGKCSLPTEPITTRSRHIINVPTAAHLRHIIDVKQYTGCVPLLCESKTVGTSLTAISNAKVRCVPLLHEVKTVGTSLTMISDADFDDALAQLPLTVSPAPLPHPLPPPSASFVHERPPSGGYPDMSDPRRIAMSSAHVAKKLRPYYQKMRSNDQPSMSAPHNVPRRAAELKEQGDVSIPHERKNATTVTNVCVDRTGIPADRTRIPADRPVIYVLELMGGRRYCGTMSKRRDSR